MRVQGTVTPAKTKTTELEPFDCASDEINDDLLTHTQGEKDGPAIIPGIFAPCPETCRQAVKGTGVDCGGGKLHRLSANVTHMTMLGVDLDHIPQGKLNAVLGGLKARGVTFWWWNTHSHAPPLDCRARILIPFAEPMPISNPRLWSRVIWPALVKYFDLDGVAGADEACRDPARVYYLPRYPHGETGNKHKSGFNAGTPFDWKPIAGSALEAYKAEVVDLPPPVQDPERPVDLGDVRERLKNCHNSPNRPLVLNVLNGKAPVGPPGKRAPGEPSRYLAWRSVTGLLAAIAEDWETSAALLEVIRPGWVAEVEESPGDHTEWETVTQLFETARAGMPAHRAQKAAERKAQVEAMRKGLDKLKPAVAVEPAVEPAVAIEQPEEDEEGWAHGLVLIQRKDSTEIKSCAENAGWILEHHPEWEGAIKFNQLSRKAEMHTSPLNNGPPRWLTDADTSDAADWLARKHGVSVPDSVVYARMMAIAARHPYDPLKDHLRSLRWDGTSRLDTFLEIYFGVGLIDEEGRDITEHIRRISRRWLLSAVARALMPGCKVDTVLTLESPEQGRRKSTALSILGGEFYTDAEVHVGNKDAFEIVATHWIAELDELKTFRRSDAEELKKFISKRFDDYRPAYGRHVIRTMRRAVLVGTTNQDDYLQDATGNRRHWPVRCGVIALDDLRKDRDSIWAEAVEVFEAAETCAACKADSDSRCPEHRWWFGREEQLFAETQTNLRMAPDVLCDGIVSWLLGMKPEQRPAEVGTKVLCDEVLMKLPSRGLEVRLGTALKRIGFGKKRKRVGGIPTWVYTVPESIMKAPQAPDGRFGKGLTPVQPEAAA